jgi:hypothetical protein
MEAVHLDNAFHVAVIDMQVGDGYKRQPDNTAKKRTSPAGGEGVTGSCWS